MTRRTQLSLVVFTLLVAACTSTPGTSPEPSPSPSPRPSPSPTPPVGLDGRQFLSVSVTEDGAPRALVPGTRIRLSFSDGSISAQAGCNIFGGSYSLDGDILIVTGGAMTEMGCDEPRHAQDDWLFAFLGSVPTLQLNGNDLVLTSGSTVITLLDREVAEPDQQLVGPTWILTSIIDGEAVSSVPSGVTASLVFAADGQVAIQPGCNSGGGSYTVDGNQIAFRDIVLTDMACMGPAGDVEHDVSVVLTSPGLSLSIDAGSLTIQASDAGLQFSALGASTEELRRRGDDE